MVVVGIDPGNEGAIVFIDINNGLLKSKEIFDMPTLETEGNKRKTKSGKVVTKKHTVLDEIEIRNIFISSKIDHVFLEKAQSMPGQGAPGTFSYGCNYGILRGICVGLEIPYTLIHPATWKRVMMANMDRGKAAAIVRAKQLFPKADIGKKDGRAEALLLGYYGIKQNLIVEQSEPSIKKASKIIKKK